MSLPAKLFKLRGRNVSGRLKKPTIVEPIYRVQRQILHVPRLANSVLMNRLVVRSLLIDSEGSLSYELLSLLIEGSVQLSPYAPTADEQMLHTVVAVVDKTLGDDSFSGFFESR